MVTQKFVTNKIPLLTEIEVDGKKYRARGHVSLHWELKLEITRTHIDSIKIAIPNQVFEADLTYYDHEVGDEIDIKKNVHLENLTPRIKKINLGSSVIVPKSIDFSEVSFYGDEEE